jgi:hypothetical protein
VRRARHTGRDDDERRDGDERSSDATTPIGV